MECQGVFYKNSGPHRKFYYISNIISPIGNISESSVSPKNSIIFLTSKRRSF